MPKRSLEVKMLVMATLGELLVMAATCSPVPIAGGIASQTCRTADHAEDNCREMDPSLLYPYAAAFAVKCFNISMSDMNTAASSSCPFHGVSSRQSCPVGEKPGAGRPDIVNQDGSCPWTYVECFDPDRIPMSITMAQCQCSACIDPYTHNADPNLRCEPVFYNMKVLRKTQCVDGHFRYEETIIRVPVSCACMRQRSV